MNRFSQHKTKTNIYSFNWSVGLISIVCVILINTILNINHIFSTPAQEKNSIYYNQEGWEYLKRGDNNRAILSFKNALKLNSQYNRAIIGLGNAYLGAEAYKESFKLFNEALKIDRQSLEAINGTGFALIGLGNYAGALKYFDKALKISERDIDAKYGVAYIYYLMDKNIWAKRKLNSILKINPYHYKSLLLMADIQRNDDKTEEAKGYIQKALDSNSELPDGYIKYGQVLLRDYNKSGNLEYLNKAMEEFNRALSIQPENIIANRSMGYLALIQKDYDRAASYLKKALSIFNDNSILLYNLAIIYEKKNELSKSLEYFIKGLKSSPSDSILQARLEDFLVLNNYAIGHPLRTKFSKDHFELAMEKLKINLTSDAVMNLQRSLLLNPSNRESRESLKDRYLTFNYHRFYIDELKTLLRIFRDNRYQDMLRAGIIKRRDMLYHREGYSTEKPPRDVPMVLTLNFWPRDEITFHPYAGEVIANYITFILSKSGRLQTFGVKKRLETSIKLESGRWFLGDNLEKLNSMIKNGDIEELDYILMGSFHEGVNYLSVDFELLDFHTGVVIEYFNIAERGRENVAKLALRASKRLYNNIPFKGRVLKTEIDNGIVINLGLFDGIKQGDSVVIYKHEDSAKKGMHKFKKKIVFVIDESDTIISSAKPLKKTDGQLVDINDTVYPFNKRRAKLIE